jgi:hypothetical protein
MLKGEGRPAPCSWIRYPSPQDCSAYTRLIFLRFAFVRFTTQRTKVDKAVARRVAAAKMSFSPLCSTVGPPIS